MIFFVLIPRQVLPKLDHAQVYEKVWERLNRGGAIGIFPEGGSHDNPHLIPLKGKKERERKIERKRRKREKEREGKRSKEREIEGKREKERKRTKFAHLFFCFLSAGVTLMALGAMDK